MTKSDGSLGGEQIEGRRAVLELLRARKRRVRVVNVSTGVAEDPIVAEIAERADGLLKLMPPEKLSKLARTETHQGVVALANPLQPADFDDLCANDAAFVVAVDGVTDPRNLGAIMRVAETNGATGVAVPRHRSAHVTPTVAKAAAGAIEYLPIALVGGIPNALERARQHGCWTVGLDERGDTSIDALEITDQRLVLVLGAEGRGLARLTRQRCDVVARIPMYGHVASLNVATAAAIAFYEIARRRHK